MTKTLRIQILQEVRKYGFECARLQCQSCSKTAIENLTIDRIIPLARGEKNDISNLKTLRRTCNQRKTHNLAP
ncbi:HNH endonuclease [Gloeocapsa sp. BRSZ]